MFMVGSQEEGMGSREMTKESLRELIAQDLEDNYLTVLGDKDEASALCKLISERVEKIENPYKSEVGNPGMEIRSHFAFNEAIQAVLEILK